jgi:hypothetical protein
MLGLPPEEPVPATGVAALVREEEVGLMILLGRLPVEPFPDGVAALDREEDVG